MLQAEGRVLPWGQASPCAEFWMVTEFNPLEPNEHVAKQLLPIYVPQQLPSACAASALPQHQLLGKPRKKGLFILCAPTHACSSEPPACGSLAAWEAFLQVIQRAPEFGVLGKGTGISVSHHFKIERKIRMLFLL